MNKTIYYAVFLLIITGFFVGCADNKKIESPVETNSKQIETIEQNNKIREPDVSQKTTNTVNVKQADAKTNDTKTQTVDLPIVNTQTKSNTTNTNNQNTQTVQASATKYKNGTYTKPVSYLSPAGNESMTVTFTVNDDVLTGLSVTSQSTNETGKSFQTNFKNGINKIVVGKKIDSITAVGAVNGASLTSKGFDNAVIAFKSEAKN